MNENLEKLVTLARNKKAGEFKTALHAEISSRMSSKIADMKSVLSKNMFSKKVEVKEDTQSTGEAPSPSSVEHTHDDGTTHSHEGGDEQHVHEDVQEAKSDFLSEALWKPKEAEKWAKEIEKGIKAPDVHAYVNSVSGMFSISRAARDWKNGEVSSIMVEVGKKGKIRIDVDGAMEMSFGSKKQKDKFKSAKEAIKKINDWIAKVPALQEAKSGGKEAYQKYFNSVLAKYKVKSADELSGEQKKKFYDEIDAGWEGDNEED